jgi:hypothetical protein
MMLRNSSSDALMLKGQNPADLVSNQKVAAISSGVI